MTDDPLALLAELVAIDSVNPDLDPTHPGEGELADFVAAWGRSRGLQVTFHEGRPGRPAVLLRAPGRGPTTGPRRTLLLNAHLDTVGVRGMREPFRARRVGDRLVGRGAMDMKASLAVCLLATAAAARRNVSGDVTLMAVPDEEHGSTGTVAAMAALTPLLDDLARGQAEVAAIVTEPTDLALHVAHRGFALFDVRLTGKASHTSKPEQGVNALTHLGRVLREVDAEDGRLRAKAPHRLLGHGSWQAVLAQGGEELFTTPAHASVTLERRTLPGEGPAAVAQELRGMLERAGAGDAAFAPTVHPGVAREPFEADPDAEIVRVVASAIQEVVGAPPALLGAPYWTDAALVAAGGAVPTVLFGPVGGGIHQPDEWVDVASIGAMAAVLERVIDRYCG